MGAVYSLGGKANLEPQHPDAKLIMDYLKDGKSSITVDEVRMMCPSVVNPEVILEQLAKGGFLRKDSEGGDRTSFKTIDQILWK